MRWWTSSAARLGRPRFFCVSRAQHRLLCCLSYPQQDHLLRVMIRLPARRTGCRLGRRAAAEEVTPLACALIVTDRPMSAGETQAGSVPQATTRQTVSESRLSQQAQPQPAVARARPRPQPPTPTPTRTPTRPRTDTCVYLLIARRQKRTRRAATSCIASAGCRSGLTARIFWIELATSFLR